MPVRYMSPIRNLRFGGSGSAAAVQSSAPPAAARRNADAAAGAVFAVTDIAAFDKAASIANSARRQGMAYGEIYRQVGLHFGGSAPRYGLQRQTLRDVAVSGRIFCPQMQMPFILFMDENPKAY